MATRTFREKNNNNNKAESFFFCCLDFNVYTDKDTEKELERENENKRDEFCWKENMRILSQR